MKREYQFPVRLLAEENLNLLYDEPVVFHCNHYNLYLQRTIEDAGEYISSEKILQDGAAIAAYSALQKIFVRDLSLASPKARLSVASSLYSQLGFGLLPVSELTSDGGKVVTPVTHYSFGWLKKWGKRSKPADYFTCGFLQAALALAHNVPLGVFSAKQVKCLSLMDSVNEFVVTRNKDYQPLTISPGVGVRTSLPIQRKPVPTSINEDTIVNTLRGMPIVGNDEGLIPAFGVLLTRHFANYYNYLSYETEKAILAATGETGLARDLFVEAGNNCAFHTFGGIMSSDEWYGLVEPQCKTREDWVSGIVACVNALGWGRWTVTELVPEKNITLNVQGGYESNYYLAAFGSSNHPVSYLACGATSGIMNLLYHGDITKKPDLTSEYYQNLFTAENAFEAHQTQCRAMGSSQDDFVARRHNT